MCKYPGLEAAASCAAPAPSVAIISAAAPECAIAVANAAVFSRLAFSPSVCVWDVRSYSAALAATRLAVAATSSASAMAARLAASIAARRSRSCPRAHSRLARLARVARRRPPRPARARNPRRGTGTSRRPVGSPPEAHPRLRLRLFLRPRRRDFRRRTRGPCARRHLGGVRHVADGEQLRAEFRPGAKFALRQRPRDATARVVPVDLDDTLAEATASRRWATASLRPSRSAACASLSLRKARRLIVSANESSSYSCARRVQRRGFARTPWRC